MVAEDGEGARGKVWRTRSLISFCVRSREGGGGAVSDFVFVDGCAVCSAGVVDCDDDNDNEKVSTRLEVIDDKESERDMDY